MKKFTLIALLSLMPLLSFAQDFAKYENMKKVDAVVMTSRMFKLLTKIDLNAEDPETQKYIDLIENLEEMRVFSSKAPEVRQQMAADVASFVKKGTMEELMRVTDDGKTVKFYYEPGKNEDVVSQFFMFMEGRGDTPSVILNITGEIDLTQLSNLAKDFNIPGGKDLENLENKKI